MAVLFSWLGECLQHKKGLCVVFLGLACVRGLTVVFVGEGIVSSMLGGHGMLL